MKINCELVEPRIGTCIHSGPCRYTTHSHNSSKEIPYDTPGVIFEYNSAIKFDSDKPRMELMSPVALNKLSQVLTFGAKKYADNNWRNGINYTRLLGAILRHVFAYLSGESKDPESGLSHIAHAMCGCMFLLEYEATKPQFDDRYKQSSDTLKNNK